MALRDRDMLGAGDPKVWAFSQDESRTVITKNGVHFLKLAAATKVHAGLVIVPGNLNRADTAEFLVRVLDYAWNALKGDLTNLVITRNDAGELTHQEVCKAPACPATFASTGEGGGAASRGLLPDIATT